MSAVLPPRPGITLSRAQLEDWVGYALTDDQVVDLGRCVAGSSIPQAIATIAAAVLVERSDPFTA